PITLTLNTQTDEDQDPATDTPTDGTATATRQIEIGATEDITLSAPARLTAAEDDGVANSTQGVAVDLGIEIDITDADGSETADPSDPRFAAVVTVRLAGLPAGATVNGGTLAGELWTGTVAEANALVLGLPGDYNGAILSKIEVRTPEGVESSSQGIVITPTPDIEIDGTVVTDETDAPVELLLSAFISVLVSDPDEAVTALSFALPGLPAGTAATDGTGAPAGRFDTAPDGTVTFRFDWAAGDTTDPGDVRLILPADFSTESPATTLAATLEVTTTDGTANGTVPVVVHQEGDLAIADATLALAETDDVVTFRPADSVLPAATDLDGSEAVALVAVVFTGLPPGARISEDGGASFTPAPASGPAFLGTLAAYRQLLIELPRDFSTANPASTLYADIGAITDEGGLGLARLDVTLAFEPDVTLAAPARLTAIEDGDGIDGQGVTVALGIAVAATDADGSEDTTTVEIAFAPGALPTGATFSTGSFETATGLWTGSMAAARALAMTLPGDWSGTLDWTVTAIGPEARVATDQTLLVRPAGDLELAADELVTAETDAPVTLTPSDAWTVGTSDSDGSEAVTGVVLTLQGLPPGVTSAGVPAATIAYDPAAGGTLTFTGTLAQYQALSLTLPTDYSTESPDADGLTLAGTLRAATNEDATGAAIPLSLRVTPEGDVTIDDSLPDTVPDETDDPTPLVPAELL
ncbi:hypothetical protein ACFORG_18605, partial [Lutimaribacter marinistellae]